jgi:hypothetical protein
VRKDILEIFPVVNALFWRKGKSVDFRGCDN